MNHRKHTPTSLDLAFDAAMREAAMALAAGRHAQALDRLAVAHILGQREFLRHARVHARMFHVAWRQRDLAGMLGQAMRLALVPVGHALDRLPLGNTGLANVSAFRPMPVPAPLQQLIEAHEAARRGR